MGNFCFLRVFVIFPFPDVFVRISFYIRLTWFFVKGHRKRFGKVCLEIGSDIIFIIKRPTELPRGVYEVLGDCQGVFLECFRGFTLYIFLLLLLLLLLLLYYYYYIYKIRIIVGSIVV